MQARIYTDEKPQAEPDVEAAGNTDMGSKITRALPQSSQASQEAMYKATARSKHARRQRLLLIALRTAADGALLGLAFALAYWLRYSLELGRDVVEAASYRSLQSFYPYIAGFVAIGLLAFQMRGLYALPRGASWFNHMRIIGGASLIAVAALTLGALLFNPVLPSRGVFVFLWVCVLAIFGVERFLYRSLRVMLWRRGINIRRAVVVGTSMAGQRIMKDVLERAELGYSLAGYISDAQDSPGSPNWQVPLRAHNRPTPRRLGTVKDLEQILGNREIHEVIVALPATHHAQILNIIDSCRQYGLDFKLVPDLFEMRFNEVRIDALNGVPLIGVKELALRGFNLFLKRMLDLSLAAGALLVSSAPMLVIALLVKTTSPGPVLFKQRRVGRGGRHFTCYKFRTMYADAEARLVELEHLNEADGPLFKIRDDPRRTPFGKFLRLTSLDELPQIVNILKGEMSWVGPRPSTPSEVAQYSEWHLKRLDVTPGLTGLWQVSGRSDLSFEDMVKLDIYYAENWSLGVDAEIILKTIPAVLKREGAY